MLVVGLIGCGSDGNTGSTGGDPPPQDVAQPAPDEGPDTAEPTPDAGGPTPDVGPDTAALDTADGCAADECTIDGECIPAGGACDDGDECTVGDVCADKACQPGAEALMCDDGVECTDDTCEAETGCVFTPNTAPCDDGSKCTDGDSCADGTCVGGPALVCDDGNACTQDSCDADDGCGSKLIVDGDCRPQFDQMSPPRGATVLSAEQLVTVSGTVTSGAGPITALTVNGATVEVAEDTGAFSMNVEPLLGGNTLVFDAEDSWGATRKRVQAFQWSTKFYKAEADKPETGMVDPGVGVWLSEAVFAQLSTALEGTIGALDLADALPSPVAENGTHKVFINNVTHDPPALSMAPAPGGVVLTITVANIHGDVQAKGKQFCLVPNPFGGCSTTSNYPDVNGDLNVTSVVVVAVVSLDVVDHALVATVDSVEASVNGADVTLDNSLLDSLVGGIVNTVVNSLKADIEQSIQQAAAAQLGPALQEALASLAFASTFDMPPITPGGESVPVSIETDFSSVLFDAEGAEIRLRARATAPHVTPYDNLGVPARVGCLEAEQLLVLLREMPLEFSLADDFTNELLYAAWYGGLLEFVVPDELLPVDELTPLGVSDLTVTVSGMLAPTLSDCATGEPRVHIGDIRVDAEMTALGGPMNVVVFASLIAGVEFVIEGDTLSVGLTEIEQLDTEVTVVEKDKVALEPLVTTLIADQVVPGLLDALGGGALPGVPLPEIDLGNGASLGITPEKVVREGGNTIVQGALK